MKHLRRTPWLFLALLLYLSTGLTSCINQEEFELDKLNTDINLTPGLALPLMYGNYTIADFLEQKPDTLIYEGQDSLITLVLKEDSLYTLRFADFYETPVIDNQEESIEVGNVEITDESFTSGASLQEIASESGSTELQAAIDVPGSAPLPSFSDTDAGEYQFNTAQNMVNYVIFESGNLDVSMTNKCTFPINATLGIFNTDNEEIVNEIVFTNVAPGATVQESRDLAGAKMTPTLNTRLKEFGSPGSASADVAGNDSIIFSADAYDMVAREGEVKIDNHSFETDTIIEFASDAEQELAEVKLADGEIRMQVNSQLQTDYDLFIKLPSATINGDTVKEQFTIPANSNDVYTVSLADAIIGLSPEDGVYNQIPIVYRGAIDSQDGYVYFTKDDRADLSVSIENLDVDYVTGYFGQDTIAIDEGEFELGLDIFDEIDGDFEFTDPQFTIEVSNKGIGLPASLDLNMLANDGEGNEVDLGYDFGLIDYPASMTETKVNVYTIDKNTSNIVEMLALPPDAITYGGQAVMNPEAVSHDNFVTGDAEINFAFETRVPFTIAADNLQYTDTFDLETPETIDEFVEGQLIIAYENGLPFDVGLAVVPYNSETNTTYSVIEPVEGLFLNAATTENGVVTQNNEGTATIAIDAANFQDLANSDQMLVTFSLSTYQGNPAELHANYPLSVSIRVNASGDINIE